MADAAYEVRLTLGAERDLQDLYRNLADRRSTARAETLLDNILGAIETLEHFPDRGATPGELAALGIRDYRQIVLSPYRITYRVIDTTVFIVLIVDGRRDMQALLERRLLGP
jgi:toxin ParE1/3/4